MRGSRPDVNGRVKHFFSIYKKMVNQDKTLDQIYDLFAVRIIVDICQRTVMRHWVLSMRCISRFRDVLKIILPCRKPNMYQSLHTTLIGPNGQPFEIQIRTYEMHQTAEYGIAAHWKYKESGGQQERVLKAGRREIELAADRFWNGREICQTTKEFLSLVKERSGPVLQRACTVLHRPAM